MLEIIEALLRRHKRPPHKAEEDAKAQRKQALAKYAADLAQLERLVNDKNVHLKSREFFGLVHLCFKEALQMRYEATIQEIQEEAARHRHYNDDLRGEVQEFLSDMAIMEYGYPEFRDKLKEKYHEREMVLHKYMKDLENEGDHVRRDTRQKITKLVSEKMPHSDREMLLEAIERFRSLLHRL